MPGDKCILQLRGLPPFYSPKYDLKKHPNYRYTAEADKNLRLNAKLYDALAAWAEDDFRSVNGQIEYLLTECVRQRKKNGKYVSDQLDVPPELDLH